MASILAARGSRNKSPIVVAVIGVIVLIAGIAVATIRGTHLRGSGLGTVLIVVGIVLILVALWRNRANSRSPQKPPDTTPQKPADTTPQKPADTTPQKPPQ